MQTTEPRSETTLTLLETPEDTTIQRVPRKGVLALALPALAVFVAACASAPPAMEPTPTTPVAGEAAGLASIAESRITAAAVQAHIDHLASDEMRGRDTPSPELDRAAEYLAARFAEKRLSPAGDNGSFIQRWPFERMVVDAAETEASVTVNGQRHDWRYAEDYFAIPAPDRRVAGVPVYAADPMTAVSGLPDAVAGNPLVVNLPDGLSPEFGLAIQAGMQSGAAGVVLILDDEVGAGEMHQFAAALEAGAAGQLPIPVIGLRHDLGQEMLRSAGLEPRGGRDPPTVLENLEIAFRTTFHDQTDEVPNVVAMLRGSDPALADEFIVYTAHFDHVGVGAPDEAGDSIYNGADDNASGTAALLQVAAAFAALPTPPARSVLFLAVSGEEKGLLGSAYFAENPTVPAGSMVANINMDMVARNAPDTVHAIGEDYTTMGEVAHSIAREHPGLGLTIAPDPDPEEQVFLRSDHFSFARQGIPAIMFTTWIHDDYHQPSDTPDRVDPDKAARVARLAFLVGHRIATDPARPEWTAEGEQILQQIRQMGGH